MGKMVRWSKRRGWEVGPTPYRYHVAGVHMFQRLRFKGPRLLRNRRRRPI
jgi:hypothetical protein